MKNHHLRFIILPALLFFCTSCVSVKLAPGKGKPADDVKYEKPESPFAEIKVPSGDKSWLSSKTGNTISYVSECQGPMDPSLEQLATESLSTIGKLKIISTKNLDFNFREAQTTVAEGEVDGVPVKIELMVFKKNSCNYTLSYAGVLKNFDSEKKEFDKFLRSFKAQ